MKERNMTFRREEIEKLSTWDLENILRTELDSDTPERETVLLVLSILEDRDPTNSQNRPEGAKEAWDGFVNRTAYLERPTVKTGRKNRMWITAGAAAAAIVLVLLATVPQTVGAENIFEILGRWTRDLFSFSDWNLDYDQGEYVFQTDNKDLQQIYDTVVEHGVTAPVVPSWIPEGYVLDEMRVLQKNDSAKIYAKFSKNDRYIQITIDCSNSKTSLVYPKDSDDVKLLDFDGVQYYLFLNENTWNALWENENVECSLTITDTEQTLYKIIKSIHKEK